MKFYDVTMQISEGMPVYENNKAKKPVFKRVKNSLNQTVLTFNLHTGTHVDFPSHVFANGENSTNFELNNLITPVKVFDLCHVTQSIKKKHLEPFEINKNDFVLLKTRNSYDMKFNFNYIYLDQSAAQFLKDKKVKGIGIDALDIEKHEKGHSTYKLLLGEGIILLKGLVLSNISQNTYQMIAMPIKIENVEALPVSVILVDMRL